MARSPETVQVLLFMLNWLGASCPSAVVPDAPALASSAGPALRPALSSFIAHGIPEAPSFYLSCYMVFSDHTFG